MVGLKEGIQNSVVVVVVVVVVGTVATCFCFLIYFLIKASDIYKTSGCDYFVKIQRRMEDL